MKTYKYENICIDNNLLFLIQKVTKESTNEILVWLWDMMESVTSQGLQKTEAQRLNKRLNIFYKKTDIPVRMDVRSSYLKGSWASSKDEVDIWVNVSFPQERTEYKSENLKILSAEKMEKEFGMVDEIRVMQEIRKPAVKAPRYMKGIV